MALSAFLVLIATIGGLILGLGLALMRLSHSRLLSSPAGAFVALMRSLPLVLMVFLFFFLVPLAIGPPTGSLPSALIAFVIFEAAFYCEIIRAGINNVSKGQTHAGLATGL